MPIVQRANSAGQLASLVAADGATGGFLQDSEVTAAARTVLDDTSIASMLETLLVGVAWTDYVPAVTASSGTITTVGAVDGAYLKLGRTVFFRFTATITTNGSGAGILNVTLPFAPIANKEMTVFGRSFTAGVPLQGRIRSGVGTWVGLTLVAGTYPGGDGVSVACTGVYEAAA